MLFNRLLRHFTDGVTSRTGERVGVEVETIFTERDGSPLSAQSASAFFERAAGMRGWSIESTYRASGQELIDSVRDPYGSIISKEIGWCNIEVASPPLRRADAVDSVRASLDVLYSTLGYPRHTDPILRSAVSLLPSEPSDREAEFLRLDGRDVTNMMAGTSSVQFTVDVDPKDAAACLSRLGGELPQFLQDYPQDALWRRYVRESRAGYRADRYGGPLLFGSLEEYCAKMAEHRAISGGRLVEEKAAGEINLHQFIKSIWWYFRLKRYGDALCIEIRPQARRGDEIIQSQLNRALCAMGI